MEKRRVKLKINGIICGLITEESDEYMQAVSEAVGSLMKKILAASPFITREAAALTVALSFCDEMKKSDDRLLQMKNRVHEMEKKMLEAQRKAAALQKENGQLWEEASALLDKPKEAEIDTEKEMYKTRIEALEAENALLRRGKMKQSDDAEQDLKARPVKLKNPLRHDEYEQQGFVSFFEKEKSKE